MRVGTGGVLLPYYSAFRTAETFRMLEALYPGRIDLGIGRAPGGDARTAQAVDGGRFPDAERFPQQVWELSPPGTLLDDHPSARAPAARGRHRAARSGCSARRITAARSPPSSACASPSPTSSIRAAATRWRAPTGRMFKATERGQSRKSSSAPSPSRRDRRRSRAPRRVDRPAPAAHGAQHRLAGADARGGRAPPLQRRGAAYVLRSGRAR